MRIHILSLCFAILLSVPIFTGAYILHYESLETFALTNETASTETIVPIFNSTGISDADNPIEFDAIINTVSTVDTSDFSTHFNFSTFLGSESEDYCTGIAVDDDGFIYVTGAVSGSLFPTYNAYMNTNQGMCDWFVTKFSPDGQELIYSTYLGGSGGDIPFDIEVDSAGNAIIAGMISSDFPLSGNIDSSFGPGAGTIAIVKLNATGNGLIFTTQFGCAAWGVNIQDIELDADQNIYGTGYTQASDFPLVNAYSGYEGEYDCILFKLNSTGSELMYSTYFGGSECEWIYALAVDEFDCVFVGGNTESDDLPFCNAMDSTISGSSDAFVFKLNITNNELLYCTVIGGSNSEHLADIIIDSEGNLYATGNTNCDDFPIYNATYDTRVGALEAFVFKMNATGTGFIFSTYLGGPNHDKGKRLDLDQFGNIYIAGATGRDNFPIVNAEPFNGYVNNIFMTKLNPDASFITCSTFVGQSDDYPMVAMVVDSDQNVCLAGVAKSYFASINALFEESAGDDDGFVLKFNMNDSLLGPVTTHPEDMIVEFGNNSAILEWRMYDTDLLSYEIAMNGEVINSSLASSDTESIAIYVDTSTCSNDEYSLCALDSEAHLTVDYVNVIITDGYSPLIDHPVDLEFEDGIGNFWIEWIPTDDNPSSFELYRNNSKISEGPWDGSSISIDVSHYSEGLYNLTLQVTDLILNCISDSVWIRVWPDVTPPVICSMESPVVFIEGNSENYINWTVLDAHSKTYAIEMNETIIRTGELGVGESSIILSLVSYIPGEYNLSLIVTDLKGNTAHDSIWVSILQSTDTTETQPDPTTTMTTDATITNSTDVDTLLPPLSFIITIGSLSIIVVVIVLIFRSRGDSSYSF